MHFALEQRKEREERMATLTAAKVTENALTILEKLKIVQRAPAVVGME